MRNGNEHHYQVPLNCWFLGASETFVSGMFLILDPRALLTGTIASLKESSWMANSSLFFPFLRNFI